MANDTLVRKICSISPHVEMLVRRLYWSNVKWLSKKVKKNKTEVNKSKINYKEIESFLVDNGVVDGSLAVVHSAYGPFKGRGKTPNELIDMLLGIVGKRGTLAMPAMPKFKNSNSVDNYLTENAQDKVYEYDVDKSPIKTGVLPLMLHKREGAVRSRHPINSMVAFGPLAKPLMENNLRGTSPLACGIDSSWNKCVESEALVIGFGTELTHSLTMIHVAEDVLDDKWPINSWYVEKNFLISDGEFIEKRKLRERAPHWGALHFGERTLCKDLINEGILKSTVIDGIVVEVLKSKELISFLEKNNTQGYPYFWTKKWNR